MRIETIVLILYCIDNQKEKTKQYKRKINLFEHKAERIARETENIKNITTNYLESNEFKELIADNITQLEKLFQELSSNQIEPLEYILKWVQMFYEQIKKEDEEEY